VHYSLVSNLEEVDDHQLLVREVRSFSEIGSYADTCLKDGVVRLAKQFLADE